MATKKTTTRRRGRPQHDPTKEDREKVLRMILIGLPHERIATVMGLSKPTVYRHYRDQLDHGADEINSKIAMSLVEKALGDGPQSVTAAIFLAKVRLGWKERQSIEVTSPESKQVEAIDAKAELRRLVERHREASLHGDPKSPYERIAEAEAVAES